MTSLPGLPTGCRVCVRCNKHFHSLTTPEEELEEFRQMNGRDPDDEELNLRVCHPCWEQMWKEMATSNDQEEINEMTYDITLRDVTTGNTLAITHQKRAKISVAYNYSGHFTRALGERGIFTISGLMGATSIPLLEAAADRLQDDVHEDPWRATEGNAKRALLQLVALARMRPEGVWNIS